MFRGVVIAAVACGVMLPSVSAEARIRLNDAEIIAGALVVSGWTDKRHQTISLDGRYTTRSSRHRKFVFHVSYFPPGCAVTLKMGDETREAVVANCSVGTKGEAGAAGLAGPKGDTGATGPAGLAGAGAAGAAGACPEASAVRSCGNVSCPGILTGRLDGSAGMFTFACGI